MANPPSGTYSREAWEAVAKALPENHRSQHPVLATLQAEHRYMATMMQVLTTQMAALEKGDDFDSHILYEVMHYMTHFPDAFHHPREDMVYQRAGELDPGILDSVDTLQRDHDYLARKGAEALHVIELWRDGEASVKEVLKPGREYVSSLYRHMSTEEKLIFPQIADVLSAQDWRELEQEELLAPVADPVFGPRVGREYRNLARKARRAVRRGVEDATMMEWIGLEAMLESFEVLSMALDNGKAAASNRFTDAVDESKEILDSARTDSGGLLLVPMRCVLAGSGGYFGFLRDCGEIVRDTVGDLRELNKGMRERARLGRDDVETESAGGDHTVH